MQDNERAKWAWSEGTVDPNQEHIKLSYGDVKNGEDVVPIALLSLDGERRFAVQFIPGWKDTVLDSRAVFKEIHRELDFYLVDNRGLSKEEPDPWAYAIHHSSTGSNIYSLVHWSWFPKGIGDRNIGDELKLKKGQRIIEVDVNVDYDEDSAFWIQKMRGKK